jgi:exodeoxyribonuclease VII large subunit
VGGLAADGRCDVVIVGRGGGAAEDLAAFNDESVVRAVAAFPVPVVSAVGHEVDVTLCDLAADLRAATPTAAAEAVVPVRAQVLEQVETAAHRLAGAALRRLAAWRTGVEAVAGRLRHPEARVLEGGRRLDAAAVRLERAIQNKTGRAFAQLATLESSLGALSPLAVLERGYSLAADARGRLVRDALEVQPGDRLSLRFHRGAAEVEVVRIEQALESGT